MPWPNWVVSADLAPGPAATTYLCGGTYLTNFTIVIDDSGSNFYTGSGTPGPGQYDLRSLMRHEFGHATGWVWHFSASDTLTCNRPTSSIHTMCSGLDPGTTYKRSLEYYDMDTFARAY